MLVRYSARMISDGGFIRTLHFFVFALIGSERFTPLSPISLPPSALVAERRESWFGEISLLSSLACGHTFASLFSLCIADTEARLSRIDSFL